MIKLRTTAFLISLLPGVAAALQTSPDLTGIVSAAGSPLRDCAVSAYQIDPSTQKAVGAIVSRTRDDGTYSFRSLKPGSYVLIVSCAGDRVYQGMAELSSGVSSVRHDISLEDPFTGRWRLNIARSILGPYHVTQNETREYSRAADTVTMSWSRLLQGNTKPTGGSLVFKCDGREYGPPEQTITCRFRTANSVEGMQKPPQSYYVRSVEGTVLTINTYTNAEHSELTAKLVYDREQ
jgi:hypothetical protein